MKIDNIANSMQTDTKTAETIEDTFIRRDIASPSDLFF